MRAVYVLRCIAITGILAGSVLAESIVRANAAGAQMMDDGQPMSLEALQATVIQRNDATGDQPISLEALRNSDLNDSTLPSPESRSEPIAMVTPINGQLMASITNDTGALVTYEVVGDTERRILESGESAMLQGLSLPSTITLVRQDEGLLDVEAESLEEGMLKLSLTAEPSLDDTQGVIRIQEDGQVFVN